MSSENVWNPNVVEIYKCDGCGGEVENNILPPGWWLCVNVDPTKLKDDHQEYSFCEKCFQPPKTVSPLESEDFVADPFAKPTEAAPLPPGTPVTEGGCGGNCCDCKDCE